MGRRRDRRLDARSASHERLILSISQLRAFMIAAREKNPMARKYNTRAYLQETRGRERRMRKADDARCISELIIPERVRVFA